MNSTEIAVRHLFSALQAYHEFTYSPSLKPFREESGGVLLTADQAKDFLLAETDSMSLDLAKAILCGAILQVAYAGMKKYSTNAHVPDSCSPFSIQDNSAKAKFCVGRDVHGIPLGLIVYAGRVQYNHWEDGTPSNKTVKAVFQHLCSVRMDDVMHDMVYELDWPCTRPVSQYILQLELKWNRYEDYIEDMEDMLR